MSALHAASDRFALRPDSSVQNLVAWKNEYTLEGDDVGASQSKDPQETQELEYEEEEVDETVREDMAKLEDTFPGISDRFRLVNRIGEGISWSCSCPSCQASSLTNDRYILDCIQSRGSPLR
jgi:cell division control protein 7